MCDPYAKSLQVRLADSGAIKRDNHRQHSRRLHPPYRCKQQHIAHRAAPCISRGVRYRGRNLLPVCSLGVSSVSVCLCLCLCCSCCCRRRRRTRLAMASSSEAKPEPLADPPHPRYEKVPPLPHLSPSCLSPPLPVRIDPPTRYYPLPRYSPGACRSACVAGRATWEGRVVCAKAGGS